ncbi:hypothetical protein NFI95_04965 [Acetobacteraceae bacterium KSS8]|uniref:Phage tail protein n=1 Tax=Endosaccharibacter trunci TaxID=2812733 RepID=A0ABT1W4L0_9PROT|nr:hypothetical protein [Acetobacteraceae bacterium KSS8]
MADLSHLVGGDLFVGPGGRLSLVAGSEATQQRVLRRLLTSRGSYIWQPAYGAGLPGLVGQVASQQQVSAIIKTQMTLEPSVLSSPEPVVRVTVGTLGDISAVISYSEAETGLTETVSLSTGV